MVFVATFNYYKFRASLFAKHKIEMFFHRTEQHVRKEILFQGYNRYCLAKAGGLTVM